MECICSIGLFIINYLIQLFLHRWMLEAYGIETGHLLVYLEGYVLIPIQSYFIVAAKGNKKIK